MEIISMVAIVLIYLAYGQGYKKGWETRDSITTKEAESYKKGTP